jgi:DNA mismatch repair ATPase MutS
MSGKSTYLRQVALCVVMAQVGSFVPASFASLAPRDRLLARMGSADSLETNSSSFMVEMQVSVWLCGWVGWGWGWGGAEA